MSFSFEREKIKNKSLIFFWGLYDLANQFFALNIVSLYFVRWVTIEKQTPVLFYSISFGVSMFLVAIFAPFLGSISDLARKHRFFLVIFTLLSVVFTISLGLTENVVLCLIFFSIANFGCQAAVVFYNALLVNIVSKDSIGFISGIGKMLGYCGALLGLYIIRPMVLESGYRAAFIPSGIFFLIFALPCILFVKDKKTDKDFRLRAYFSENSFKTFLKQFFNNTSDLLKSPSLTNFLKATFFCLCVVNIVILFMSVYITKVFVLSEDKMIDIVCFSTVFAIFGSIGSGYISDRLGYKNSLIVVWFLWVICLFLGVLARNALFYWFIGPLVGISFGSTWVVSRALAIKMVPSHQIGQMFGIFSFIGYFSAIVGAFFWGGLIWFLSPLGILGYRIALLSLCLFLLLGLVYLRRI